MDLFCPHCTRRVTVPDDKAGQVLSCPLCTKQFMAPSLAPAPTPPAPPPSAGGYGVAPVPAPPPPPPTPQPKPQPAAPPPPPPPSPPGEYTRSFELALRGQWLPFAPPAFLVLVFLLSFLPWQHPTASLWGLAFGDHWKGSYLVYTLLLWPCILIAAASVVIEKKLFAVPPQLERLSAWKDLLVSALLSLGFLLLTYDYIVSHTSTSPNLMLIPMKLAYRLHVLATVASLLMCWVHWRKKANLPPPKVEVRW